MAARAAAPMSSARSTRSTRHGAVETRTAEHILAANPTSIALRSLLGKGGAGGKATRDKGNKDDWSFESDTMSPILEAEDEPAPASETESSSEAEAVPPSITTAPSAAATSANARKKPPPRLVPTSHVLLPQQEMKDRIEGQLVCGECAEVKKWTVSKRLRLTYKTPSTMPKP